MGKVHLIVEGSTVGNLSGVLPTGGVQVTKETTNADSARMLAWMVSSQTWIDADGNPISPTVEQIINKWWEGIIQGAIDGIKKFEQEKAADGVKKAVQPISVT